MARKARGRTGTRKKTSPAPSRRRAAPKSRRPPSRPRGAKKSLRVAKKAARKRTTAKARAAAPKPARRTAAAPVPAKASRPARPAATKSQTTPTRLSRERRILAPDVLSTPPSSLDLDRHGSAVRTGRAERRQSIADHSTMSPVAITGGDPDVSVEDAYFAGEEAPGGDNPTPDQDIVDDIGRALGVEYQDSEELRAGDKVAERDKRRWELDPASSEDYRSRK